LIVHAAVRLRDRIGGFPGMIQGYLVLGARVDDHRFLEFILVGVVCIFVDEANLMLTNRDDVTVLERMLLDQPAVDISAVGAVQVFQEGIVENVDDQRMVSTDRRIVDPYVVVREAADRIPLLGHVVLGEGLAIEAKDKSRHGDLPLPDQPLEASYQSLFLRKRPRDFGQGHRNVVAASVLVGQLGQLFSYGLKISTKGADS